MVRRKSRLSTKPSFIVLIDFMIVIDIAAVAGACGKGDM
jgi:hypothetical protein